MLNSQKFAVLGLIVGCIIFGLGSIIVALISVKAYALAFWRLALASIIFFALYKFLSRRFATNKKAIFFAILSGIFLAFDLAFWHEGIYAVGPGISTLLNSLQIFWLSLIGFFYFGEKQSKLQIFSLFLAIFGVFLIAVREFNANENALLGFIYAIASGLALALSMLCIKKVNEIEKIDIFVLMFLISISGAASLIVPTLLFNPTNFLPQNLGEIGLIFIYAAFMQCFAWGLIAFCVPLLSLHLTGLLLLSEPVATLFIDKFLLGKDITQIQWLGAVLTMLAIYLGSLKSKKG
ncbi:MAG: DMT family transporter [Campylobacter sp.]|nr:DMT family transporter [Campylobacter sp.]